MKHLQHLFIRISALWRLIVDGKRIVIVHGVDCRLRLIFASTLCGQEENFSMNQYVGENFLANQTVVSYKSQKSSTTYHQTDPPPTLRCPWAGPPAPGSRGTAPRTCPSRRTWWWRWCRTGPRTPRNGTKSCWDPAIPPGRHTRGRRSGSSRDRAPTCRDVRPEGQSSCPGDLPSGRCPWLWAESHEPLSTYHAFFPKKKQNWTKTGQYKTNFF